MMMVMMMMRMMFDCLSVESPQVCGRAINSREPPNDVVSVCSCSSVMPSRLNLSYLSVGSRLCEQVPSDEMVEGLPLIHNHSPSDHTLGSRLQAGAKSWETGGSFENRVSVTTVWLW